MEVVAALSTDVLRPWVLLPAGVHPTSASLSRPSAVGAGAKPNRAPPAPLLPFYPSGDFQLLIATDLAACTCGHTCSMRAHAPVHEWDFLYNPL